VLHGPIWEASQWLEVNPTSSSSIYLHHLLT
jgi:hypothetical protein